MPEIESFETVVLQVFDDPVSAQMAQGWLEAEQIPCHPRRFAYGLASPGAGSSGGQYQARRL